MRLNILLFFTIFLSNIFSQNIITDGNIHYFADQVVVKYKNSSTINNSEVRKLYKSFGIHEETRSLSKVSVGESLETDKIYTLKYSGPHNPIYIAKQINKLEGIEWAEPKYLYETTYTPNDPIYNGSDLLKYQHLQIINASDAWDITTGSEDVIIAIVDTGVDWDHPDLADNIWINPLEIKDNLFDDDGNGYIDDVVGWDFGGDIGTGDNDPNEDNPDHGTHVAGLASAVTDNGVGIASIGFKSKLMCVKTSRDDLRSDGNPLIAYGYEGIKYAADNGADIINCSWGGYSYSNFAQSIIEEAVSKGALIIAAAGNDNSEEFFYPASYKGVLSVAATNSSDQKASWSNYGTLVDVTAPGLNIYSTWYNDTYDTKSGTSMAAPITAGLAALTISSFPDFTPLQIAEQIRVNSTPIDQLNLNYENKIGYGRINALSSVTNTNSKSVRISEIELTEVGNGNEIYESGEEIEIALELTNYLTPLSNLNINLSSPDGYLIISNQNISIGQLNTLEKVTINQDQLKVLIKIDSPTDVEAKILVAYQDDNYADYEWITISINPTYQIHTTDNLSLTFNSLGSIGFDDFPNNFNGQGLKYNDGPNLMYEGALMYGTSENTIVNTARNGDGTKDNDFTILTPIKIQSPGIYADKETYTKFDDTNADPSGLGIETEVYTYSFSGTSNADFIFIRYIFNNTKEEPITNFYAGQYWDFDMDDSSYDDDIIGFDNSTNLGYAHDNDGDPVSTHIGLSLLSEGNMGFFAMNKDGRVNPIISYDGFTDEEKWTSLSSGFEYTSSTASDISLVISAGPYYIESSSNIEVDFIVVAGESLEELQLHFQNAKSKYNDLPTSVDKDGNSIIYSMKLNQNYPNPFNPLTTIKYQIPSKVQGETSNIETFIRLDVFDVLGREVAALVNEKQKPGNYEVVWNADKYPSGIYFYRLQTEKYIETKKMILLK